jgi:HSP20 family protein
MDKQSATATAAQKEQQEGRQQQLARRHAVFVGPLMTPLTLLQRFFTDDLDSLLAQVTDGNGRAKSQAQPTATAIAPFVPKIDVTQRGNDLVVRADLPGVNADDIVVEIGDDVITISGERQQQRAEENDGVYRVERTYGAFFREIPLPEGALVDQAKASFKDGVLEITVPAPPEQVSRGRRIEVKS